MSKFSWQYIINRAKTCQSSVKKDYKLSISKKWSYFFAKSILNLKKDLTKFNYDVETKSNGTHISNQITKKNYLDMCKRYCAYVEKNKKLPAYVSVGSYRVTPALFTEITSRILVYYVNNNALPAYVNANSKIFTKPDETTNTVYDYFVKVFGSFGDTIDGALNKIAGNGYGYYYDDVYSNKTSIDRMKNGQGVNCTDSCQVFYNIMLALIKKGKYRKVECLHVLCSGGDGHVRLRITLNDGSYIYRDPAAVLSSGSITYNWCSNGELLAVNPSWFMENLNR